MNGLADEDDLRLRFDVLTKPGSPELHRYWTTRDRAASVRLHRLAAEILGAVEAGVFPPRRRLALPFAHLRLRRAGVRLVIRIRSSH